MQAVSEFWDRFYAQHGGVAPPLNDFRRAVLNRALTHFGRINEKTILDLGCGRGESALFFAESGAKKVIAADISRVAIEQLSKYAPTNVLPVLIEEPFFGGVPDFDYIFGVFILHHLEPFNRFVDQLAERAPKKGYFLENNAASRLLVWCRQHLVGRLWLPKYGDPYELPLDPHEVALLRARFDLSIQYPMMKYFQLIPHYFFRGRMMSPFVALDEFLFRHEWFVSHSYLQCIALQRTN